MLTFPLPTADELVSRERVNAYAVAIVAGVCVGVASYVSLQIACALVLTLTVVCLYVSNRMAGMVAMWLLWLAIPLIRRLFDMLEGPAGADPLSLAPFAATALIALIELSRTDLDMRIKTVLGVAAAGVLIGVPTGASEPESMLFAFGAYLSAVAALAIGYAHAPRTVRSTSLHRALLLFGGALAAYGIAQYVLPLPRWDEAWQSTVAADYGSIGSPEEGKVRVWSALNGPGTLGAVLAIGVLLLLASPRLRRFEAVTLALMTACLALTFVRSAWVGLAVGIVAFGLAARGRGRMRAAAFALVLLLGVIGLQGTGSTGTAFTERVLSIGSPDADMSAQARRTTTTELAPEAVTKPLGTGLGSAGEAANLRGAGGLSDPDNGYLSILYQNGPFGLLLFCGAMLYCVGCAFTVLRRRVAPAIAPALVALLVLFATMEFFGDALYGVTGAAFWYLAGVALRLRSQVGAERARPPELVPRAPAPLTSTRLG